jgi:hypothetical protein
MNLQLNRRIIFPSGCFNQGLRPKDHLASFPVVLDGASPHFLSKSQHRFCPVDFSCPRTVIRPGTCSIGVVAPHRKRYPWANYPANISDLWIVPIFLDFCRLLGRATLGLSACKSNDWLVLPLVGMGVAKIPRVSVYSSFVSMEFS